jgi:hydroxymethylpyrimidine pyrophosphatase-like HAD family hydrolase
VTTVYVDVDGTLVGPGGDLLASGTTRLTEALLAARAAGVDIVPVTGRSRVQVRELCRLLRFPRGIAELGCVHVDGHEVRYEFGDFPFTGETPVEAMLHRGAVDVALGFGLEPHEPWNEGREGTYLLRGDVNAADVNRALADAGFGWAVLVDNGALRRGGHVLHLAPTGIDKTRAVARDRARHGVGRDDAVYVGDGEGDVAVAPEVGACWLVANAEPALEWPHRTDAPYGDGVAEVLERITRSTHSSV